MGGLDTSKVVKNVQTVLAKHSPEILTGIGIAGMLATTVMAVKATPKAIKLLEKKKAENEFEDLTVIDIIKTTWKCYIPAVVTGATSTACLIGASSINVRRNAAIATAYNLSHVALSEYKEKVLETVGEKKEQLIRDSIAKEKLESDPVSSREVVITEKGDTLCYDGIFGRYFKSDIDTIKRAINAINRKIVCGDMYVSLNDFYSEIGLSPTRIGYDLGWNIDDGEIELDFSSQLAEDGTPCLVIEYNVAPKYNYSRFL